MNGDIGVGSERRGKVESIQLLRAIAACAVAYVHLSAMAWHIGAQRGLPFHIWAVPGSRVALFFVISGCIMVYSSRRYYSLHRGSTLFWSRRLIRTVPIYWIATLVFAAWLALWGTVDPVSLGKSLLFIPYAAPTDARALPLLWPAWTLSFEMMFYLIFGSFLIFGRWQTVVLTSAVIAGLILAGPWVRHDGTVADIFTRAISLQFIVGMGIGLGLVRGIRLAVPVRILVVLGSIAWLALDIFPHGAFHVLGIENAVMNVIPAAGLAIAVLSGPLPVPRFVSALGDISYSIFLWHVPVANVWIFFYQMIARHPGPYGFLITALLLTLVSAAISYYGIERPLTGMLNRRLTGSRRDGRLEESGV